jgi:hypothetical protein
MSIIGDIDGQSTGYVWTVEMGQNGVEWEDRGCFRGLDTARDGSIAAGPMYIQRKKIISFSCFFFLKTTFRINLIFFFFFNLLY